QNLPISDMRVVESRSGSPRVAGFFFLGQASSLGTYTESPSLRDLGLPVVALDRSSDFWRAPLEAITWNTRIPFPRAKLCGTFLPSQVGSECAHFSQSTPRRLTLMKSIL